MGWPKGKKRDYCYGARICVICQQSYEPMSSRQKTCQDEGCKREWNRLRAAEHRANGGAYKQPTAAQKQAYRHTKRGILVRKLGKIRRRAEKAGLSYTLTPEWLSDQWDRQDGRCALTRFRMKWLSETGGRHEPYLVSVDRIDPDIGYIPENCRLVCYQANMIKGKLTESELRLWLEAVLAEMES